MTKPTKEQITKLLKEPKNFAVIKFSWSDRIVVPYDDGVMIIKHLKKGEHLKGYNDDELVIKPIKEEYPSISPLAEEDYIKYKFRALMGTGKKDDTDS